MPASYHGAIVTGGAQGLGLGIARALATAGYRVAVLDRDECPPTTTQVAEWASVCDVSDRAAGYGIYAATKEGIRTLTRIAAVEWGPDGIRVNAISPSARTPAFDAWKTAHPYEAERRVTDIPLRRLGDAEHDIGAAVALLASDAASYVTGTTLVVVGGAHYLH